MEKMFSWGMGWATSRSTMADVESKSRREVIFFIHDYARSYSMMSGEKNCQVRSY